MQKQIKARLHKELGFLALFLIIICGCEVPPQKHFNCTAPVDDKWECVPLEGTSRSFECSYLIKPENDGCIPEWCDLPLQDCNLPPLTGGKDSCGNDCSKPSIEWPNCNQ